MAEADCEFCRRCGLRTCDVCGGVSFEPTDPSGFDMCGTCVADVRWAEMVVRPRRDLAPRDRAGDATPAAPPPS